MGLFQALSATMKSLLIGSMVEEPLLMAYPQARHESVTRLFDYIAQLTFFRGGGVGQPPIPFQINRRAMYTEWPDAEVELELPCIALIPGRGAYEPTALTPWVDERTRDVFGNGTVVQALGTDYSELFQLEIWAATRGERRALVRGLDMAMSPSEDSFGLKLKVPNLYDEIVYFTPMSSTIVDDQDSARNRRKARIEVQLRVPLARLITYTELDARVIVTTLDATESCPLDIEIIP